MIKRRKEYRETATEARLMRRIHADSPPVALSDASFTSATPSAYVIKATFYSAEAARSTLSSSVRRVDGRSQSGKRLTAAVVSSPSCVTLCTPRRPSDLNCPDDLIPLLTLAFGCTWRLIVIRQRNYSVCERLIDNAACVGSDAPPLLPFRHLAATFCSCMNLHWL